ncbi:MAG: alanine racemase [Alphaproteobacteria bacterium]|jgi:alanine racemase|nr:alanine racemase [Alphaproteobacteria bacterium]MDP6830472.1 alanine racemase [Alphaproteobacteria bacterium]
MTMLRSAWVEIDLAALRYNVGQLRERVGPDVAIMAVVKSNGFGCDAAVAAKTVLEGGADSLAVGSPDDARAVREAGIKAPMLLYASTPPSAAGSVAALDVIATVHDMESLAAFDAFGQPLEVQFKIEAGLGRLGLNPGDWAAAYDAVRASNNLRLTGIYTHLNGPDDPESIKRQIAEFERAYEMGRAAGFDDLHRMVASSNVVLGYPELNYDAVNAGRLLFHLLDGDWAGMITTKPVISAVKSTIIQVKEFPAGARVGFLGGEPLENATRLAVLPIGFGDGFKHRPPLGEVLLHGRRAAIVGRRGIEHTVIDVSGVDAASVGDEVVLLGHQGEGEITGTEVGTWLDLPLMEILPRLARTLPRIYLNQS